MANRVLRDWTDSDKMSRVSVYGERFFTRLIMKADDFGCYTGNLKLLRAALFPFLLDEISLEEIAAWIEECASVGLLHCYEVDGKPYLQIRDFGQTLRVKKSKYPSPGTLPGTEKLREQGYVYLIGIDYDNPVKVGYSLNPWARLKEISVGSPVELSVLLTFKGDKSVESSIHKILKECRTKNEWFKIPKDVIDVLIDYSKTNNGDIIETLRSTTAQLRSVYEIEREVETETETETETEVESESARAEFVDENVPRELKITLPDKNEIFEEIFSDELFVEELRRGHPKKNIQRAWEECWLYHSQKPSPPALAWQWRQKLSTWLINTKDGTSKKTNAISSRREGFAKRNSTDAGG